MSKLDGNQLWETSRMIMPEHKVAILEDARQQKRRVKPQLDEQKWEEIGWTLSQSMEEKTEIEVVTFGDFADNVHRGVVERMDANSKRVKMRMSDGYISIPVGEIVEVNRPY